MAKINDTKINEEENAQNNKYDEKLMRINQLAFCAQYIKYPKE